VLVFRASPRKFCFGQICDWTNFFSRRISCFPGQCRSSSALQSSLFPEIALSEQPVGMWVPRNKAARLWKAGNIRRKRAVIIFVVQWVKSPGILVKIRTIYYQVSRFFFFLRVLFSVAFNNPCGNVAL